MPNHGRWTLRYCDLIVEFARFLYAADKRCYNVFSICPAAPPAALADLLPASASVRNDGAKLQIFCDIIAIIFEQLHQSTDNEKFITAIVSPHSPLTRARSFEVFLCRPYFATCLCSMTLTPKLIAKNSFSLLSNKKSLSL